MSPRWPLPLAALLAVPMGAAACGACVWTQAIDAEPAILPWSYIGGIVYLAVAWGCPPGADAPAAQLFGPVMAPVLLLLAVFFGGWMFGPLLVLGLSLAGGLMLLGQLATPRDKSPTRRWFERGLAFVAVVALVTSAWIANARHESMSKAERLVWLGETPVGRSAMGEVLRDKDVATMRAILALDPSLKMTSSSRWLAENGDASIDAPLILDALARCEKDEYHSFLANNLDEDLEKLVGRRPVTGKSAREWQALLATRPWEKAPVVAPKASAS